MSYLRPENGSVARITLVATSVDFFLEIESGTNWSTYLNTLLYTIVSVAPPGAFGAPVTSVVEPTAENYVIEEDSGGDFYSHWENDGGVWSYGTWANLLQAVQLRGGVLKKPDGTVL